MPDSKIDIAIVGGGISGVYSAWRLQRANPDKKVMVFEASDHVAGRLLSVRPPDSRHGCGTERHAHLTQSAAAY